MQEPELGEFEGLPALRRAWIEERGDTEVLAGPTSDYGKSRLTDPKLTAMRFDLQRPPRRAKSGAREVWVMAT